MKIINLDLNKMSAVQKFKRNYSLFNHTKDLLLQFNIPEKIVNDWKFLSKMELEWTWHDVNAEYRTQISKLHPDKVNGNSEEASKLVSIYVELKKRFEKRINPPPLVIPDYFQVDNSGNECRTVDEEGKAIIEHKNKIIYSNCKFCSTPFSYNSNKVSHRSFCDNNGECKRKFECNRQKEERLKKRSMIIKTCANKGCNKNE